MQNSFPSHILTRILWDNKANKRSRLSSSWWLFQIETIQKFEIIKSKSNEFTHDSKRSRHFHFHPPMLIQFDHLDYPDRFLLPFDIQLYRIQYLVHQVSMNIRHDNNPGEYRYVYFYDWNFRFTWIFNVSDTRRLGLFGICGWGDGFVTGISKY